EDAEGKLVGIVSYRALLRHFANEAKERASTRGRRRAGSTSVGDVMRRDVITVGPDTPTLEAIALMRRYRVGCLPVVQGGQLVAMVTEDDFMNIAAELLEQRLRG
ncbi:MAG: CBS domain-containing protein, partial [Myxococcota bacterium]|nr:CBS domain-containing protein [Myxococcota bacterium]